MVELLLIKAAGQLLVVLNKLTSKADVYTLVTLWAVSRYWHETLMDHVIDDRSNNISQKSVIHKE